MKKTKRARHRLFDEMGIIDACLLVIDGSIRVCCNDFVTHTHTHTQTHTHTHTYIHIHYTHAHTYTQTHTHYTHAHTHTHTHFHEKYLHWPRTAFHTTGYAWGHKVWHVAAPRVSSILLDKSGDTRSGM